MSASASQAKDTADGDPLTTKNGPPPLAENLSQPNARPQMSVSSDEVNYLVFRYLQECGFVHSAFSFVHESMLGRTGLRSMDKSVPPGALVTFVQKGLQYVEIEERLNAENNKDGQKTQFDSEFSLLSPAAMASITRPNPPIQLNVPPAAAAAAVRARLEAQAKLDEERRMEFAFANKSTSAQPSSVSSANNPTLNGSSDSPVPVVSSIPVVTDDANAKLARRALAAQAAAAQVAALDELQQISQSAITPAIPQPIQPAAAMSELLLLQQQQQQQRVAAAAEILSLQQQSVGSSALVDGAEPAAAPAFSALTAAAAVAAAAQTQPQGVKRQNLGSKRSSKKQKSTNALDGSTGEKHASGIASLEEAVAQLEAKNREKHSRFDYQRSQPQQTEIVGSGMQPLETDNKDKMSQRLQPMDMTGIAPPQREASNQEKYLQRAQPLDVGSNSVPRFEARNKEKASHHEFQRSQPMDVDNEYDEDDEDEDEEENDEHSIPAERRGQEPAHKGQEPEPLPSQIIVNGENDKNGRSAENHNSKGNGENELSPEKNQQPAKPEVDDTATMARPDEILKLEMHQSEVFMCAWNPIFTHLIATGSGDASARIWEMGGKYARDGLKTVKLLPHGSDTRDLKNKDVTTLEWSSNGDLLATGSYDGVARIWSRSGALLHTLRGHHGPIFSLKWNKRGNYLLSGSYDKTTIVWDVSESTGFVVQQFTEHHAPALDVDWKDNETFASCSTDKTVQVCRVGTARPLKIYVAHTDEVNGVKWDPTGRFLASCSDDCTAKVWEVDSPRQGPLYDFNRHTEEIYTLKWSPNTNKRPLLATASFDGTVMLWNIEDGSRYRVFDRHSDSVYSVAFSPSGDYLASGSLAGQMYIWDIEAGQHIKSYKGTGDIFEVAWNKEETRVAGCFSSNVVAIVDFKKPKL